MAYIVVHSDQIVDLVHIDDPAVVYTGDEAGWLPVDAVDAVGDDATRIQVRPLNGWQRLECQGKAKAGSTDLAEQIPFIRETLKRSILSIDGDKKRATEFLKSPGADALLEIFTAINDLGSRPTTGQSLASATGGPMTSTPGAS